MSRDESTRHHRRKRHLISRPSPSEFLKTPPQHHAGVQVDTTSPQGLTRSLHLASPMEREKRRVLSVELRDIAHEVEQLPVTAPPCERTLRSDDWSASDGMSSTRPFKDLGISRSAAVLPTSTEEPSHTFPTYPPSLISPKEEPGWGLVPLFNSVRSKLESFAEIFLTPVKSRRDAQKSDPGEHPGKRDQQECSGGLSRGTSQPSTLSPVRLAVDPGACGLTDLSSELAHGDGTREDKPSPSLLQRTPPNHRLQSEASQSPSILCRPPLQRYLSCPLLPLTQYKRRHSLDTSEPCTCKRRWHSLDTVEHTSEPCTCKRRWHSLDTAEHTSEPCTCKRRWHSLDTAEHTSEPCTCKRRRHSLGSMEDCLSFSSFTFSLSCLRKENHPSVLRQSPYQPGDVWKPPNCEGSPASLCLDEGSEQGFGALEEQVTKESLPGSDFKSPENLHRSKENKVSNIRIRKRALRQEGKLTPLGLPKRVRLQKEDFSLEEIYTNKNYRTPTEKRKFETIFEEPVMKDGALILTSQRPLRRIMIFKDVGAAPRKRKKKGKAVGRTRRCTAASTEKSVNYELLLQHKLSQLEAALQEDTSDP